LLNRILHADGVKSKNESLDVDITPENPSILKEKNLEIEVKFYGGNHEGTFEKIIVGQTFCDCCVTNTYCTHLEVSDMNIKDFDSRKYYYMLKIQASFKI
jgi:hypothetical protein